MGEYVVDLREVDGRQVSVVGGKGAQLGELSKIAGVRVPPGFCVTVEAFRRAMTDVPGLDERLDELARVGPHDRKAIGRRSAEVRRTIEAIPVPDDIAVEIAESLGRLGEDAAYAVRSSATAEDLPTASFAGQQDTFLNVVGVDAIVDRVRRCWASLFTERAASYRQRNRFDHRRVDMAVVVQQLVVPKASGVMFTADPVTSNRRVVSVEAIFGLGEALVSGLVNPDVHEVRDDEIVATTIGSKRLAIVASPTGGTEQRPIEVDRWDEQALTDIEVVRLAQLGRRIDAHFGRPQDIEWCLADDVVWIVQSRPITTLFPVPVRPDEENHVYVSVGHQQMMTDAMPPLGISVKQLTSLPPMPEAGGRLFVEVTNQLASPESRAALLEVIGRGDPLIRDALETLLDRDGFIPSSPNAAPTRPVPSSPAVLIDADAALVTELVDRLEASLAALERDISNVSGTDLFALLLEDFQELKRLLVDPQSFQVLMAGMDAARWLNERLEEWLGEKSVADTLGLSVAGNVTAEMGLALLDVADTIRPHREVVAFLHDVEDDDFLGELPGLEGGQQARDSIAAYLERYGMRCVGEIDITRPRWSERPATLLPLILRNVEDFEEGEAERRFEKGRRLAEATAADVQDRLRVLPDGERKAIETEAMIARVRTFAGYRELPKFGIVKRYGLYKRALLDEAARLVRAGVIDQREDIFFLTFDELHDGVRTQRVDNGAIAQRKDEFRSYQALTPPRVLTSDGEALNGSYRRHDLPPGALAGVGVSAGTVEGRARVILDMSDADLEPGDILVTAYTDPSWSPLFVAVAGLVTEVGGRMTHGAVVAREYGLPTVVGVDRATQLIEDGQRIRIDGTDGFVEILPAT